MTTLTLHNTQPAVILSLSIVAGPQAVTLPLANLTPILSLVWQCWQWLEWLTITAAQFAARLVFTFDRLALWLTLALILALAIKWSLAENPGGKFSLAENSPKGGQSATSK